MYIDAHAHLDRYEGELGYALEEVCKHKIFTISTSMDIPSYKRNLKIAERCKYILPAFGIHPWQAPEYVEHLEKFSDPIRQSPILGEIGLDHFFVEDTSQYSAQLKVFEFFLKVAKKHNKIVNVHTKGAEKESQYLLKKYNTERSIIHWYSGPLTILDELLAIGAYFTIGVEVLSSSYIRTIAKELPLDRLLTETDNPGGAKWLTGKSGMPVLIKDVIITLADLKKTTSTLIIETVKSNFLRLIKDDPWLSDIYFKISNEKFIGTE